MSKTLNDLNNLALLARYDFLDICLLGETGTGKSHTARLIHDLSPRAEKAFIAVNCAELTPSIIEAELFGYEKGAFTGAIASKEGKFEAAAGGTLFLDEIGELSSSLQAKLLKVVEEKCVTRVGGNRSRTVDVRIVYATHRDLSIIRDDLRYRVAAHAIHLKPLRERRDEIASLARVFLKNFSKKSGRELTADEMTLRLLEPAEWKGNIRELRSFVEKVCLDAMFAADKTTETDAAVTLTDELLMESLSKVAVHPHQATQNTPVRERNHALPIGEKMERYLEQIETHLLRNALEAHNYNQTRAAKELGISRSGLIKKLKRMAH
jgi:transcriptional regulator with GAF, ATPase, and Fis domain